MLFHKMQDSIKIVYLPYQSNCIKKSIFFKREEVETKSLLVLVSMLQSMMQMDKICNQGGAPHPPRPHRLLVVVVGAVAATHKANNNSNNRNNNSNNNTKR